MYASKSTEQLKFIHNRSRFNIINSNSYKFYGIKNNINNVIIRRKYQSIIQPPEPPSALNYQLYKLSALNESKPLTFRSGIFASLLSKSYITRLNLWSIRHPLTLAVTIATLKNSWCDYMAQTWIEKRDRNTFNYQRFVLFALFGTFLMFHFFVFGCYPIS